MLPSGMNETSDAEALIVLTTFPDLETARQIGTKLVEEQVAACVNLLPGAESIYRWQGVVDTAREIPAVIKTTRAGYARLEATLRDAHPYEVPEVLALSVADGSEPYLRWVAENVLP